MADNAPTLLVNLATGQSNAGLLQVAGGLAGRLGAAIIGVAARQPTQPDVSGTCYVAPDVFEAERAETDAEMRGAEAEFRDALPLLRLATQVSIVEIAADEDVAAARQRLTEISRWLARHDIAVEMVAARSSDDDAAQLRSIAQDAGAGLIVAGAYGHSRLREWAFGGVTRSLLQQGECCALLSH